MPKDCFHISVQKGGSQTYGMTLLGTGPCIVSEVVPGGPAALSGVCPGYVVLEIDGGNVARKGHTEVREIIGRAEKNGVVMFKFSTLDTACDYFGPQLRNLYETRCKRKSQESVTRRKSSSPRLRKSDGKKETGKAREEPMTKLISDAKEKDRRLQSVGVQADETWSNSGQTLVAPKPSVPSQLKTAHSRYGPESVGRANAKQTRELKRWMRADSPNLQSSPHNGTPVSPLVTCITTEFVCQYYLHLDDVLGPTEGSVFHKNVEALKAENCGPKFWVRLVFDDKKLAIYRPEGKFVSCSRKHLHSVFVHEDGLFLGLVAIGSSRVQTTSPVMDVPQTMDVFRCHIMCIDPEIKAIKPRQTEVLAKLLGKDRVAMISHRSSTYFPHNANDVADHLKKFISSKSPSQKRQLAVDLLSNTSDATDRTKPHDDLDVALDATANLNSASELRNSVRKYGASLGLQRHSISTESIPNMPKSYSYSGISRHSYMEGTYINGLPRSIAENEVFVWSLSSSRSEGMNTVSSTEEEMDRKWKRESKSYMDISVQGAKQDLFDGFISPQKSIPEPKKFSLLDVLSDTKGLNFFQAFLKQEHSEENVRFWLACQDYRSLNKHKDMQIAAKKMFEQFLSTRAAEPINVDHSVRRAIDKQLLNPTTNLFDVASKQVFDLMNTDSFPRFLKSSYYAQFMQLVDPAIVNFNMSMPNILKPDTAGTPRQSGLFSWLSKKKVDSAESSSRRSLPPVMTPPPSDRRGSTAKNPLQKLIEKGRKSFSARVKSSRRESLMDFVTQLESPPSNGSGFPASKPDFEFRKPLTPPLKSDAVAMRRPHNRPASAGKEKRLSLQFQRSKVKEPTTSTEWTFSARNSLDNLDAQPFKPQSCSSRTAQGSGLYPPSFEQSLRNYS